MMRRHVALTVAVACVMLCGATSAQAQDGKERGGSVAGAGGEVDTRQLNLRVMLGFPWNGARVDLAARSGKWGAFAEFDMAFLNRLQPTFGIKRTLLDGERLKTWAELGLGHQYQYGTLSQQGPSAVALLGAELGARRIFGYGWLRSRHTLLIDRITVQTAPREELTEWETEHLWSPGFALGMGRRVGVSKRWIWQGGIDWRFVDRGKLGFVLPGLHGMITVKL